MTAHASTRSAKPRILLSAYDVSMGESSEGYVALNLLRRLSRDYRILLVTRRNNRNRLLGCPGFREACPDVKVIGYDLPRWASWWKAGARFYRPYAYLWHLFWPLAFIKRRRCLSSIHLVHLLNFHNDNFPSLAWLLGIPVIWGPINHNELSPRWRRQFWPKRASILHTTTFLVRWICWNTDPFLLWSKRTASLILAGGPWVIRRLHLKEGTKSIQMSQLGVEEGQTFNPDKLVRADSGNHRLIYAGRLDWIKGLDLAIEALDRLPPTFTFAIYGRGPAEPRLKALVAALGLTGRVQFTPPVSRDELVGIYSSGSLFLFPSSESAGLAWVEALTCGLPVVGFEGESSELALAQSSLNGIHLALNGPTREDAVQSLASTIQSAIGDETDPRHTRDKAIGKYSWDQKSATILQAYRSLSKRH